MSLMFLMSIPLIFSILKLKNSIIMSLSTLFIIFLTNGFYFMSFKFSVNLTSWSMVLLTLWISKMMLMSSNKMFELNKSIIPLIILCLLNFILIMSFFSSNLFSYYIFFESSIIPTFYLIFMLGMNSEKMKASFYLLFYTLVLSLPFLIFMKLIEEKLFCLSMMTFFINNYIYISLLWSIFMLTIFLVKMPVFMLHYWLPKAHVEAPLMGSMILAGVLLKLGGYGLVITLPLMKLSNKILLNNLFTITIYGSVLSSIICFKQNDMKCLIAFMSIFHMNMIISAVMKMKMYSFSAVVMMMVAHGLSSSGMFCSLNILYERTKSRSILNNKGIINSIPILGMTVFLLCCISMSTPPSLSFSSEVLMIMSILSYSYSSVLMVMILILMSCICSMNYFTSLYHSLNLNFTQEYKTTLQENLLLIFHIFPSIILFWLM